MMICESTPLSLNLNSRTEHTHLQTKTNPTTSPTSISNLTTDPITSVSTPATTHATVSLLILGAGWTSTFLLPLLAQEGITHAATSRTGRPGTLKFLFDPTSDSRTPYRVLPRASTILVTFPLTGAGQSARLLRLYAETHVGQEGGDARWILLGSTGIWNAGPGKEGREGGVVWLTRHSDYDGGNARAVAEDEMRGLGGCVLNLAGLWGGERRPRDWVSRVAATKELLGMKKSLHVVHGLDLARAVVAVSRAFTPGERWMLTDLLVYDWWALILGWAGGRGEGKGNGEDENGETMPQLQWIQELMGENNVRALPRSPKQLERCCDSREFWETFNIMPIMARI